MKIAVSGSNRRPVDPKASVLPTSVGSVSVLGRFGFRFFCRFFFSRFGFRFRFFLNRGFGSVFVFFIAIAACLFAAWEKLTPLLARTIGTMTIPCTSQGRIYLCGGPRASESVEAPAPSWLLVWLWLTADSRPGGAGVCVALNSRAHCLFEIKQKDPKAEGH